MSTKNTKTSLKKLKPAQLTKLYNETLGEDAQEGVTPDDMISAILEADKPTSDRMKHGNLDKDKKHDLSKLKIPDDFYVVRHFSTVDLANGQQMEDPSSNRIQVYDKHAFEMLNVQAVKDGKQVSNQFETLGLNVEILHDPTK